MLTGDQQSKIIEIINVHHYTNISADDFDVNFEVQKASHDDRQEWSWAGPVLSLLISEEETELALALIKEKDILLKTVDSEGFDAVYYSILHDYATIFHALVAENGAPVTKIPLHKVGELADDPLTIFEVPKGTIPDQDLVDLAGGHGFETDGLAELLGYQPYVEPTEGEVVG